MFIDTIVGGTTKFLEDKRQARVYTDDKLFIQNNYQVPYVEGGEPSTQDSSELTKRIVTFENDIELTIATEYWDGENLRHRSVNMILKTSLEAMFKQGEIG